MPEIVQVYIPGGLQLQIIEIMAKTKTIISLQILFSLIQCAIVLAQSGSHTIVQWPGPPRPATLNGADWQIVWDIADAPDAKRIWSGPGNDAGCNMNIVVTETFSPLCLHANLTVYVRVDDYYNMQLGNFTVNQPNWTQKPSNYTVQTSTVNCGSNLTIRINATNRMVEGYFCSPNAIAYIMYAVVSPDCMPTDDSSYYDPSQCLTLPCTTITGCQTCTSKTFCTSVINNSYFLYPNNTVELCSNALSHCSTCSSETVCLSCVNTSYLPQTTASGASCILCSSFMPGCVTCSDSGTCTLCDTANHFEMVDSQCQCVNGYYLSGQNCLTCSSAIVGCIQCLSGSVCTSCSNNMHISGNICACNFGYYLNNSNVCSSCNWPCQSCSSSAICLTCLSPTTISGNTCVCPTGQYLGSTGCNPCHSGCSSCTGPSLNQCSGCILPYTLSGTTCQCVVRHYSPGSSTACNPCHYSCLTCNGPNLDDCLSCDPLDNRIKVGSNCSCQLPSVDTGVKQCQECYTGYKKDAANTTCLEVCGDGIKFDHQCDDGNTISGDGCSSQCAIEANYTCVNGSSTMKSVCSYNQPISLKLVDTRKDTEANKVVFYFTLSPAITALNDIDYLPLLSCNIPNVTLSAIYDNNGNLIVTASYTSSLQGQTATILFNPYASSSPLFFATPNTSNTFTIDPTNNLAAEVFQDKTYSEAKTLGIVAFVLVGCALTGFAISMATSGKFIGVEMVGVVQAAFIGLMAVSSMGPSMGELAKIGFVNGVNMLFSDSRKKLVIDGTISPSETPYRIGALQYGSQVAYSFNYTMLLLLLPPLISLILFIASKAAKFDEKKKKLLRWSLLALCEFGLTAVFFVMYHFVVSLTVFIGYSKASSQLFPVSIAEVVLALLIAIPILVLFKTHAQYFGDYRLAFKQGTFNQMHYLLVALARILLAVVLVVLNSTSAVGFVGMAVTLSFMTYIAIKQPYISKANNIRAICNQSILSVILGLYGYCRISPNPTSPFSSALPYVIISLLFLVVLSNTLMIFKHIHDKKMLYIAKQKQIFEQINKVEKTENQQFLHDMRKRMSSFAAKDSIRTRRQLMAARYFVPENVKANESMDMTMMQYTSTKGHLAEKITDKLLLPKQRKNGMNNVGFTKEEMESIEDAAI